MKEIKSNNEESEIYRGDTCHCGCKKVTNFDSAKDTSDEQDEDGTTCECSCATGVKTKESFSNFVSNPHPPKKVDEI